MSHRESPMSRESERKKKKKFGNIIKIRWKPPPPPPRRPPFSPSTDPFSIPALRVQRYTSRLSWSNSPYTNIRSIVFNARREDLSSRSFGVSPGKVGCTYQMMEKRRDKAWTWLKLGLRLYRVSRIFSITYESDCNRPSSSISRGEVMSLPVLN